MSRTWAPARPTTGEVPTRGDSQLLFGDDVAKAQANRESAATKWPVGARAMAIAFPLGKGARGDKWRGWHANRPSVQETGQERDR
jgi:hypothetical protein